MPVTFTPSAARRIADAVKRVEAMPRHRSGDANPARQTEPSFWAMITGVDFSGLHYSFIRVTPSAATDKADFRIATGLAYTIANEDPEYGDVGYAREASGNKHVPTYTVTKLEFIGYDAEGLPAYLFCCSPPIEPNAAIAPHDHRDNYTGGFAFAVYHPGTALPQQPWAV